MITPIRGIYERDKGSGIWWIRYTDAAGKKRRECIGARATAKTMLAKRKTEILQRKKLPENFRNREVTFADLCADALEYSKAEKKSHRDDTSKIAILKPAFGSRSAADITPQEFSRWLDKATKTPATRNRYRACLSLIYRQGIRNGRVTVNPARLIRQRREDNARLRFLSAEEEKKLREIIQKRYPLRVPAFDFALNTGIRRSEQFNLTWADVYLERKSIVLRQTKNGSDRHVPLNQIALAALKTAQEQWDGKPESRVFKSTHGKATASPRSWYEPAVKAAELTDVVWHTLRHTFISNLMMKGVDVRTVQELAGHKTISMTIRYAHLAPAHKMEAVARLCKAETASAGETDTKSDTRENALVSKL
jgi:site-specific recombinase XerD